MAIKQEVEIKKSADVKILKRMFPYIKKQLVVFIGCLLLIALTTGIDLMVPYLTKVAIDDSIGSFGKEFDIDGKSYHLEKEGEQNYLVSDTSREVISFSEYLGYRAKDLDLLRKISLLLVVMLVFNFLFNFLTVYLLTYASQKIVYHLRSDLYEHMLKLSLSFFDRNPVGRLVTRVTSDMDNISKLFTDVLVTVIKDVSLIVGAVVVMLSLNFRLALYAMATLPLVIGTSFLFRYFARKNQRLVKIKLAKINAYLSESINGMKIIQVFNREKLSAKEFDEQNSDHLKSTIRETKIYAIFRPGIHLMSGISLGLIILAGGTSSLNTALEIGVIVAFFQYIHHLFRPISSLAEKFNIFQSSMASSERVFLLLDEEVEIPEPETPKSFSSKSGAVSIKDVVFSYIPGETVLKGVSLDIKPGETVALVGATGSGKTTITSLISRLYDIDSGSIEIDGVDIREIPKDALRERIAVVLQDVFLFSGDIKGNISLGSESIDFEKVVEASKYVNAHRFIDRLADGYDHEVKERGATFSAGEKQLISFARALAFDPDILVLDEATSSIDTETESLIQDAIEKLVKNRTTIIVAHRLSTIKNADKIVVLHKGEIKEVGRHEELLERGGIYYDLYRLQVQNH